MWTSLKIMLFSHWRTTAAGTAAALTVLAHGDLHVISTWILAAEAFIAGILAADASAKPPTPPAVQADVTASPIAVEVPSSV